MSTVSAAGDVNPLGTSPSPAMNPTTAETERCERDFTHPAHDLDTGARCPGHTADELPADRRAQRAAEARAAIGGAR